MKILTTSEVTTTCLAQDPEMRQGVYVDPATGINYTTWSTVPDENGDGSFTFGMVLPPDAAVTDATEYIGLLVSETIYESWLLYAYM